MKNVPSSSIIKNGVAVSSVMSNASGSNARWLTEREVATLVGCSLSRLRQDRHKCKGIPYVKFGRSVRYLASELYAYMENCRITHI